MSLLQVESVVRRFARGKLLVRGRDGVARPRTRPGTTLALRGRWGVGKTHFWKRVVKSVAYDEKLGRSRYSYVSLFGLNSIDEVKAEIVAHRQTQGDLDPYDGEPADRVLLRKAKDVRAQYSRLLKVLPAVTATLGPDLASAITFDLFGRDTLVCLDDLERRGPGLRPADVFGLVTQLRDERGCDVVLILNDGQLGDAAAAYAEHGEKAVDVQVHYDPTPEESFDVAFPADYPRRDLVHECCLKLGVTNVRLLQRVDRTLQEIEPQLDGRTEATAEDAVRAAVLLTWAYYASEGERPPFHRVRQPAAGVYLAFRNEEDMTADDQALVALQKRYGWAVEGEAAQEIANLVERGWLDEAKFRAALDGETEAEQARARRQALTDAWELFHESLDGDAETVANALADAIREHGTHIDINNAGSTIKLIRDLGYSDLADSLVGPYLEHHVDALTRGDGAITRRRIGRVEDPVLTAQLDELLRRRAPVVTLGQAFADVTTGDGWAGSSDTAITTASSEELEAFFRSTDGETLKSGVAWCLQGRDGGRAKAELADKVVAALQRIAADNVLNRVRVKQFFNIDPVEAGGVADPEPPDGAAR